MGRTKKKKKEKTSELSDTEERNWEAIKVGLDVHAKLLPSNDFKINFANEETYKWVARILDNAGKRWQSFENKLGCPISHCWRIKEDRSALPKVLNWTRRKHFWNQSDFNRRKKFVGLPVHMLAFSHNEEIDRVTIEPIKKPKLIPQRKRCQEFGYT